MRGSSLRFRSALFILEFCGSWSLPAKLSVEEGSSVLGIGSAPSDLGIEMSFEVNASILIDQLTIDTILREQTNGRGNGIARGATSCSVREELGGWQSG